MVRLITPPDTVIVPLRSFSVSFADTLTVTVVGFIPISLTGETVIQEASSTICQFRLELKENEAL